MLQLALQSCNSTDCNVCIFCNKHLTTSAGYQLRTVDTPGAVCQDCAGKHAPRLAALVDLARTAERVSRMARTSVFPPLGALLDLASAAEKFTGTLQPRQRQAG